MPLYMLLGTPIQFTVTDKTADAFNRVDLFIIKASLDTPSLRDIQITVTIDDLVKWNKVSTVIVGLRNLNGGYVNTFKGGIDEPRLVKV